MDAPLSPIRTHFTVDQAEPLEPERDWLWELLSPEGRRKLEDTYRALPHLRPGVKKAPEVDTPGA